MVHFSKVGERYQKATRENAVVRDRISGSQPRRSGQLTEC